MYTFNIAIVTMPSKMYSHALLLSHSMPISQSPKFYAGEQPSIWRGGSGRRVVIGYRTPVKARHIRLSRSVDKPIAIYF